MARGSYGKSMATDIGVVAEAHDGLMTSAMLADLTAATAADADFELRVTALEALADQAAVSYAAKTSDLALSTSGWKEVVSIGVDDGVHIVTATITFGDGGAANTFGVRVVIKTGTGQIHVADGQITTAGAGKLATVTVTGTLLMNAPSGSLALQAVALAPGADAKVKGAITADTGNFNATVLTAVKVGYI